LSDGAVLRTRFISGYRRSPPHRSAARTPFIWNRLREGVTLHLVYEPADPRIVSRVGPGVQRVAGINFVAIGSVLTVLGLWLLVGGLLGWTEVRAFRPHPGWLKPLPAPRGGEIPTLK
jgi:hypothetical protein